MDNFKLVLTCLFGTINYILTTSRRKGITMQSAKQSDAKIRQHLPRKVAPGPLQLTQECMELSNKIQVLTEDYLFTTMFMEYIKMKDPALYNQGRIVAEATLRKDAEK